MSALNKSGKAMVLTNFLVSDTCLREFGAVSRELGLSVSAHLRNLMVQAIRRETKATKELAE